MNQSKFKVTFKAGGSMTIRAFSRIEAKILCQAERIKAGLDYQIRDIEEIKD